MHGHTESKRVGQHKDSPQTGVGEGISGSAAPQALGHNSPK